MLFNSRTAGKRASPAKRSLASIIIRYLYNALRRGFNRLSAADLRDGRRIVASLAGCHLDEGSVHACYIMGKDRGLLLYELGVMGWFLLGTIH